MQTARDLFVHELTDILDAEQRFLEALGEQLELATNPQLKRGIEAHQRQTERQIERLQQVFEQIDEEPEDTECHGAMGLVEEVHAFKEENPSPDIMDVFLVGANAKVEAYEIHGYQSLVSMCREFGLKKAERLLAQSLKEEQAQLKKVQMLEKKIKPENPGIDEEIIEEQQTSRRSRSGSGSSRSRSRKAA